MSEWKSPARSRSMSEEASASSSSSTSTSETPTKESLAWFRSRRAHWRASPRRKLQAFPPPLAPYTPQNKHTCVDASVELERTPTTVTSTSISSPTTPTGTATTALSSVMSSPSSITSPLSTTSSISIRQPPSIIRRATTHRATPAFIKSVGAYFASTPTTSWQSPLSTATATAASTSSTSLLGATLTYTTAAATAPTASSTSTASPTGAGLDFAQRSCNSSRIVFDFGASNPNTPSTRFSHSTPCSTTTYAQRIATTTSIFGNAGVHASEGSRADATKASRPVARSPKRPRLALVEDYQSIRSTHYVFDPLTLLLHVYMSELSQVPVAAPNKADSSYGSTVSLFGAGPAQGSSSGSVLVVGASSRATTPPPFSQSPFSINYILQRIATSRRDAGESASSAVSTSSGGSSSMARTTAPFPLGEIGSGTSSAASKSPYFGFSQTIIPLEQTKDSKPLSSEPDTPKASGKENSAVPVSSLAVLTESNAIPSGASGDSSARRKPSFSGMESSSPKELLPSSSFQQEMKSLEQAKDNKPSSEADATKASGLSARSPKIPKLTLIEDYQSFRAAHHSFDPLTIPIQLYMSELSQVPVAASSNIHASVGLTEANSDDGICAPIKNEATGSEEIRPRPWTPYNRRSIRVKDSFTSSKRIRRLNQAKVTSVQFPSEAVGNMEAREMNLGQKARALPSGLLVDSMATALLLEVNHILAQERRANSESSVRVASKATSTGDGMNQVNLDDGRSFPIQKYAFDSEPIGQVNYCCCEWWL